METKKFIIAALVILFAGCAKDGEPGATGPAGTNGTNGNANVKSYSYTVIPGEWQSGGTYLKYAEITLPEITQAIVSTGMVEVYLQAGNSSFALPYTWYNAGISSSYNFVYSVGELQIELTSQNPVTSPVTNTDLKIIITGSQ